VSPPTRASFSHTRRRQVGGERHEVGAHHRAGGRFDAVSQLLERQPSLRCGLAQAVHGGVALGVDAPLLVETPAATGTGRQAREGSPLGSAGSRPARPSAAYERSVRGSPKCRNTPVSANQVIPAIVSPASVSTISP
jgi:hypothetical protein